jgi:hypothetical protein
VCDEISQDVSVCDCLVVGLSCVSCVSCVSYVNCVSYVT